MTSAPGGADAAVWARTFSGVTAVTRDPVTALGADENRTIWSQLVRLVSLRSGGMLMTSRKRLPWSGASASAAVNPAQSGKGECVSIVATA